MSLSTRSSSLTFSFQTNQTRTHPWKKWNFSILDHSGRQGTEINREVKSRKGKERKRNKRTNKTRGSLLLLLVHNRSLIVLAREWRRETNKQTESKCNDEHRNERREEKHTRTHVANHMVDGAPLERIDDISSATATVRPDSCAEDEGKASVC